MLKAASMSETFVKGDDETKKKHLDAVFNFVMKNKTVMPRTALRYAIEKMPADLRAEAMKK
jgi:3-methyladenine DNA glycosylase AlkD